jgi:hypothetical protein
MIQPFEKGCRTRSSTWTRAFEREVTHSDAIFELPIDIETRNTQSAVLGSMTFVNTLETVLARSQPKSPIG